MEGAVVLNKVLRDDVSGDLFARLQGWAVDSERAITPEMVLIIDDNALVQGIALPLHLWIPKTKSLGRPKLLRLRLTDFIKHYDPSQNYTAYTLNDNQIRPFGKLLKTEKSAKIPN